MIKMFGYYALHSFVNQIRKIFKSKVLLFVLICAVMGGLIGFGAGTLSEMKDNAEAMEEIFTEDEEEGGDIDDLPEEVEEMLPESEEQPVDEEERAARGRAIMELAVLAVLLVMFTIQILGADKHGGQIFLPADVNLLFPSPHRPQTILMFRLVMQMGAMFAATIYLLFQVFNLQRIPGIGVPGAFAVIIVWWLMLMVAKLLQVLIYTYTSTEPSRKKYITPAVYTVLGLLAAAFLLSYLTGGGTPFEAAVRTFNAPWTRFVPVIGWLKGIVMFAAEGKTVLALLCFGLLIVTMVLLVVFIWRIKADFYEDAMAKSEQTAAILEAANEGRSFVQRNKKDRSEKLRRDGMTRGAGASVFFWKALYNRFRFAKLRYFTKTTITYLLAAAAVTALCRFVFETESPLPGVLTLAVLVFYRAMGNPLEEDAKNDYFRLIPEKSRSKIFWSLLGGTMNCLLDLLPALALICVLLPANPLKVFVWLPVLVSIDFFATNTSTCMALILPEHVDKMVRQFATILFLYFGLLPDVAILAVAIVMDEVPAGAVICTAVNIVIGLIFLLLAAAALEPGRGRTGVAGMAKDLDSVRKKCARIGLALIVMFVLSAGLQLAVQAVLTKTVPGWSENPYIFWPATFLPIYAVAIPAAYFVMKKIPAFRPTGMLPASAMDSRKQPVLVQPVYVSVGAEEGEADPQKTADFAPQPAGVTGAWDAPQPEKGTAGSAVPAAPAEVPYRFGFGKWLKAFAIGIFFMYTGNIVGTLLASLLGGAAAAQNPLTNLMSGSSVALQLLVTCILAPIFEEFIFRRCLIDRLRRHGEKLAIATSAVCFGLFHGNLQQFIYAMLLGFVLGYVYTRTGKLRYTILLHMAINTMGNLASILLLRSGIMEMIDPADPAAAEAVIAQHPEMAGKLAVVGLFLIVILLLFITGLVLFLLSIKKLIFRPAEEELPQGTAFRTVWFNAGMAVFVLLCAAQIVLMIMGINI